MKGVFATIGVLKPTEKPDGSRVTANDYKAAVGETLKRWSQPKPDKPPAMPQNTKRPHYTSNPLYNATTEKTGLLAGTQAGGYGANQER